MCYHTKQTEMATQVESRFDAKVDKITTFKPQKSINAFDFP